MENTEVKQLNTEQTSINLKENYQVEEQLINSEKIEKNAPEANFYNISNKEKTNMITDENIKQNDQEFPTDNVDDNNNTIEPKILEIIEIESSTTSNYIVPPINKEGDNDNLMIDFDHIKISGEVNMIECKKKKKKTKTKTKVKTKTKKTKTKTTKKKKNSDN